MKKLLGAIMLMAVLAVFANPAPAAAECSDWSGDSRPCTAMEEFEDCLDYAIDAADQRARDDDDGPVRRYVWFNLDVAVCTASLFSPF